jgi:hypothetical protein
MLFLNLTDPDTEDLVRVDSVEGQKFALGDGGSKNFTISFSGIQTNIDFGSYLNLMTNRNRTFNPHNVTAIQFGAACKSLCFVVGIKLTLQQLYAVVLAARALRISTAL